MNAIFLLPLPVVRAIGSLATHLVIVISLPDAGSKTEPIPDADFVKPKTKLVTLAKEIYIQLPANPIIQAVQHLEREMEILVGGALVIRRLSFVMLLLTDAR